MLTAGSVCTGAAMLDRAVEAVLGPLNWAWHAETDAAASTVLKHHYPDVPNLGDITAVDWTRVAPVDVFCGGYPCQGFSLAGRRLGEDDDRFIWPHVFAAVRDLRPRIVLLENVPGHLSLGFGRVLGDLASIGYDARWMCLRASDVGAPHRRNRVFIAAWPTDAQSSRLEGWRQGRAGGSNAADAEGDAGRLDDGNPLLPTPAARLGRATSISPETAARRLTVDGKHNLDDWAALLPTPDAYAGTRGGTMHPRDRRAAGHQPTLADAVTHLLPTPRADRWGEYAPAIARWEQVLGRPAPEPTEPGAKAGTNRRLAAPFVEFLMGLPAGWVTDHVRRNDALRILGNGVVWQQAAAAYAALGVSRSVVKP